MGQGKEPYRGEENFSRYPLKINYDKINAIMCSKGMCETIGEKTAKF